MTATQPVPNSGTHPRMASDADSQPDPTVPAPTAAVRAAPGLWSKLTDNPLLTILGTATVGLLIFTLTRTEHRISRLEDSVHAGFAVVDTRFAAQDAKIDALNAKIDEINLNLTARMAELDLNLTARMAELDLKIAARMAELDLKIAALDSKLTAQIAELDRKLTAQIAELDRKLTALIAALNATNEIEAAIEGRLFDPDTAASPG